MIIKPILNNLKINNINTSPFQNIFIKERCRGYNLSEPGCPVCRDNCCSIVHVIFPKRPHTYWPPNLAIPDVFASLVCVDDSVWVLPTTRG